MVAAESCPELAVLVGSAPAVPEGAEEGHFYWDSRDRAWHFHSAVKDIYRCKAPVFVAGKGFCRMEICS